MEFGRGTFMPAEAVRLGIARSLFQTTPDIWQSRQLAVPRPHGCVTPNPLKLAP
jgi:hypothetical protein